MPPAKITLSKKKPLAWKRRKPKVSKNVARYVKSTVTKAISTRQEHKYWMLDTMGTLMPSSGTVISLCDVPAGTNDTSRVGDSIYLGTFRVNYAITAGSTVGPSRARVIILQWCETDSPVFTSTNILQDAFNYPTISMLRHDALRSKQFRIMSDKTYTLDTDDPQATASLVLRPPLRKVQYDNGGPTGTNKLYMVLLSNAVLGAQPSIQFMTKLNFTDS